jgi:hypothetical protein
MLKRHLIQRPGYIMHWYRINPYPQEFGPGAGRHPQFADPAPRWRITRGES